MTHVYVIQAEGGSVKVGTARDPQRRLVELRSGSELRLAYAESVADDEAIAIERCAHILLWDRHTHGEWFDVSPETAHEAVLRAMTIEREKSGEHNLTSAHVRAGRAMLRWEQKRLSEASTVSVPTIKRLEGQDGTLAAHPRTVDALRSALEAAGIEFIPENGGGPGVRLKKGKP